MKRLEQLRISNFKSIQEQTLEFGDLNLFIGGNGVGKSNLIQVFRLLREISQGNLASYSLQKGAENLLHFGKKESQFIELEMIFGGGSTANGYRVRLIPSEEDSLVIEEEMGLYHQRNRFRDPMRIALSLGSKESGLKTSKENIARYVRADLDTYRVYHFHDTSDTAKVKGFSDVDDNASLRPQAENLPAFLYWLQEKKPEHLRNIRDTLRRIAPFFDDFQLTPSRLQEGKIRLEWKETGTDTYFNASAFSDGTLRFLCLATLMLQPELPRIILLDEPELGLHPSAINLLSGLLKSVSQKVQVIVSTQSVTLLNQFGQEDIWVVEREGNASVFNRLGEKDLTDWLSEYSIGELWEKNVLGGRP